MKRHLLNLLTALSLLLCAAVCVLWVRERRQFEGFIYQGPDRFCVIAARPLGLYGSLAPGLGTSRGTWKLRREPTDDHTFTGLTDPGVTRWAGFFFGSFDGGGGNGYTVRYCVVPFWFALASTALLPTLWMVRSVTGRAQRRCGLCPACGYDLRATPDRCPECGHTAAIKPA